MDLETLKKHWDEFGKKNPLWAIKKDPAKRNEEWQTQEFFETGEKAIDDILQHIRTLGCSLKENTALDFGCGVGRLTQALCRHFDHCCGVDIAPSMIRLARRYNRHGRKCQYFLNEREDLRLFEDNRFDFVGSFITLQHIRPEYSKNYIREFVRVLAPGGVLVFQIPSELARIKTPSSYGRSTMTEALPDSAFRAQITVHPPRITTKAGLQSTIRTTVKNNSDVGWPAQGASNGRYQISLGNHWLDEDGGLLLNDDGRTPLPMDLLPAEEITLTLTITSPARSGNYILELDLVQELVAWFKDKGSATTKVTVQVSESIRRKILNLCRKIVDPHKADAERLFFIPIMEMYGIPKDEVLKLVAACGGRVVDAIEDRSAGERWISFHYYITK